MATPNMDDILGIEPKHITYVKDQTGGNHDLLFVKEVVHFKDGTRRSRMKPFKDYQRPFWITQSGQQTHRDKKDYEYAKNCRKYKTTQVEMTRNIARQLRDFSAGPNPPLKRLARSPYLYGADVSSACLLKAEYREKYPDLISFNTIAAGDIETNVHSKDEEIICMSVTCKEKVALFYLKSWIADVDDPITKTHEAIATYLPNIVAQRQLEVEVKVVDTPAQIVMEAANRLHEWKPDFFTFWNMDFDVRGMLKALQREGIDPAQVFSHPKLPDQFKYFDYRPGQEQKVTSSGKTMSINIEDRWNWVTHPASFQFIDSLPVYRLLRVTDGKDSSYKFDDILDKELSTDLKVTLTDAVEIEVGKFLQDANVKIKEHPSTTPEFFINEVLVENINPSEVKPGDRLALICTAGKLKFKPASHVTGLRWHEIMQEHYKIEYGVYNIFDSIALELLDEKTNDLSSKITTSSKNSEYKNFNSNPKRLCDDMHFWYLNRSEPCVIGSSSDDPVDELDQYVIGHHDWMNVLTG